MKFAGVEWTLNGPAAGGWVSYQHPKKPITMFVRDGVRRFSVRGQGFSTWAAARRIA